MALLTYFLACKFSPMVKSDKEAYKEQQIDICQSWYKETPIFLRRLSKSGKVMIKKGKYINPRREDIRQCPQ